MLAPGSQCGAVTDEAALALGVPRGTPVAASMIDAHAGALALFADGEKHLSKKCFGSILGTLKSLENVNYIKIKIKKSFFLLQWFNNSLIIWKTQLISYFA